MYTSGTIIKDVTVLNSVDEESDCRMTRAKILADAKLKSQKILNKRIMRITVSHLQGKQKMGRKERDYG